MPIRLGELHEGGAQSLRRLLDELFEIDDVCKHTRHEINVALLGAQGARSARNPHGWSRTILVRIRALEDLVDLLVVDEREAQRLQRLLDFLLVERAVAVLVPARSWGFERAPASESWVRCALRGLTSKRVSIVH